MCCVKYALSFALLLSLAACKAEVSVGGEDVKVHIDCETTATPAVECDVKQTKGKSEVEACWDFAVTCANGAVVTAARTCQKVKDGGTAHTTIAADKLTGLDKCGGEGKPTGALTNMTINGKPSTN
jgi:hypothetical protein